MNSPFEKIKDRIESGSLYSHFGKVTDVIGQTITGTLPGASLGAVCRVYSQTSQDSFLAEVIGIRKGQIMLVPYDKITNVGYGSKIELQGELPAARVGRQLLGRVIDGMGRVLDNEPEPQCEDTVPLHRPRINPLDRRPISEPLDIGVKSINSFISVGRGQRVAIMAGSGVGKSVLMGMMARSTQADINVIAMIGERGREVKEFIEEVLGEEGLKRSIVVAVTNDQSPLLRMRGAHLATAIAEYFSEQGNQVLLIMDSLTRFAMAQREIALQSGEPPATKGYTSSLYPSLSRLLERAGSFESGGSITGLYTVLVEGDDMDDPVTDTVRSIVDGHIVLNRKLAQQGLYPAVDVLQSVSRVMDKVTDPEHRKASKNLRRKLALYRESEDLINVGAYKKGTNVEIDDAIACFADLNKFLGQALEDKMTYGDCINELKAISMRYSRDKR